MSQAQQKLLLTLNPSERSFGPINSPRSPTATHLFRSSHLSRTAIIGDKNIRKNSTDKSIKQKEILKDIKYAKPIKTVLKTEQSTPNTDLIDFVHRRVAQNQQTVQKIRVLSKGSRDLNDSKRSKSGDKVEGLVLFDTLSIVSGKKRSRVDEPNDNYYIYWKNKAHEYLDSNMKLMEQVRKLTRQNQDLRQIVQKGKIKQKAVETRQASVRVYDQKDLSKELRNLSTIYITKIQQMQKQLKRKEIMICSYELKLHQLNNKLQGDGDRVKLMAKMKDQLDILRQQVHNLKMEYFKDDSIGLEKSQTIELNTNSSSYWHK